MSRPVSLARRRLIQGAGAAASLGVAGLASAQAQAPADAFGAKSFAEAIAALGGMPAPSSAVVLDVPTVADDGAIVPITISSTLPDTREVLILVDGNPQPLAVRFTVPEGTEAFVATRIRMAQSGTVLAAVRTGDGKLHGAARTVQVTIGGCG